MRARVGSIAEGELAHDDIAAQGLLSLIVGRLDLGIVHKGEEASELFEQTAAQLLCGMPGQLGSAELLEAFNQAAFKLATGTAAAASLAQ